MPIELRQLRYFQTVAEELHFGRAAARLNMTQPPLSQTIQALEAELGEQLFARTNRSVMLTPAGEALLTETRRLLLQASLLPDVVRQAASGELCQVVRPSRQRRPTSASNCAGVPRPLP